MAVSVKQSPTPRSRARAARALRRDIQLAASGSRFVRRRFREELAGLLPIVEAGGDWEAWMTGQVDEWEAVLASLWLSTEDVYQDTLEELTGQTLKQTQQLVALLQRIIQRGQPTRQIEGFLSEAAEGIVVRSRRRIGTVLRELTTPAELRGASRALRRLYQTEFVEQRANRIALDQVLRATATFEHAAALQAQVVTGRTYVKVWVTQRDDRVRAAHVEADGQTVALDELFKVDGELLRFPRDPAGSAGNTVNCRCWTEHRQVR